ncbi:hypothetical protein M0812_22554 [Anaeramoeba flamelloides]|uniref:Uncharacterized protein n=1 Tax=Anaeramoeba flamelloides TaxID=1746091 RepID=A0AAV7Z085_9EUKA|nr:hypothetical protein M0812_22554 [Anaeramoeba flamelloides]
MFILPYRIHKSEITYNPFIGVDEKQFQSKGSVTKRALLFMREILQSASLTSEEAFSTDCIQLLNLINVLCPTRIVTVFKTRNKKKLEELNLKEYLRVLKTLKYSTYGFPKRKFLQSNPGAQKQMALTVLHLKLQYKKKGIKYQKKDEVLRYYIDHYSVPSKKKKILGINPFFTTKSTINTISLTKSCRTKNIFYSNQKEKEKFLKKRANSLGEKLSNPKSSESGSEDDYQNKKSNNNKKKKKIKKKKNLNRKINEEDDSDDNDGGTSSDNNNELTSDETSPSSDNFEFDSSSSESEDFSQQNSSSSGEDHKGIKKRNKKNKNYHTKTTSSGSQEFDETQSSENSPLDNYPKKKKKKEPKKSYTYSGNYFGFPSSDFNTDETSEDNSSSYSNDDSDSNDNSNSNSNPDSNDNSNSYSDDNDLDNSNSDSFSTYNSNSGSDSEEEINSIDNQKKEKNKKANRNVKRNNKYNPKTSRTHKQSKTNKVRRINKTINNPQKPKTDEIRRKKQTKKPNQNKTKKPNKKPNKNKKIPIKGKKEKIDKYQIRQTLDRSAINPLPHRSNTFVENTTKENNTQPRFKLEKNESLYNIISFPIDISNIYIRKELSELFKGKNTTKENKKGRNKNQKKTVYIKNPKRRAYMHLIFHILNTIHEWDNNDQKKSNRFSEKCGFGYLESICHQGYLEAVALGKNGKALFSTSLASKKSKHFSAGALELNEKKLILSFNHIKTPILSENYTQKTFQISVNKQDLCKICIKHLLSSNAEYVLDFENETKAICALIALLHFFHVSFTTGLNKKTKKKGIGYNPIRREEKHILDLVDTVMPPLKSPNEKFTKLLSNTDLENLTKGAKRVMKKYYAQGGVNFLITLVNKSEFPLTAGFLKIRPNYIKIGMKNSVFKKVPFSANPRMLKNRTNNALFRMDWLITSTCSSSPTKPSVTIVCSSTTERSLITKAITYFFNQYKAKNNK